MWSTVTVGVKQVAYEMQNTEEDCRGSLYMVWQSPQKATAGTDLQSSGRGKLILLMLSWNLRRKSGGSWSQAGSGVTRTGVPRRSEAIGKTIFTSKSSFGKKKKIIDIFPNIETHSFVPCILSCLWLRHWLGWDGRGRAGGAVAVGSPKWGCGEQEGWACSGARGSSRGCWGRAGQEGEDLYCLSGMQIMNKVSLLSYWKSFIKYISCHKTEHSNWRHFS